MRRLFPFVVLVLLLLAGILAVPYLLRPESHRAEITDKLSKLLKKPAVIGQISMGYWPPALRLGQVVVLRDGGDPLLQIDRVDAPLDWKALFRLKVVPVGLQLNHWVLTTQRRADGSWDLEAWLWGNSAASGAASWPLTTVSWKEGEIHAVDRHASVPQELVLGQVEGSWDQKKGAITAQGAFTGIGSPARMTFSAKGQFFSSPEWSGELQFSDAPNTCVVHLEKKPDTFDAKAGAPRWSFFNALALVKFYGRGMASSAVTSEMPLVLENWQAHVSSLGNRVTFENTATISGGLSELKGTLVKTPAGPVAHLDVALKDVPAAAVWSAVGENLTLNGKITALAKDVELVLSTRTLSTVKGMGYWELKDGRYLVPAVSMKRLAKAKTMSYVKKKFPDLDAQGLPVTKLSAHWQAKNGEVTVEDGLLVLPDVKAAWVGKLDMMRQGLDGYVRLQIQEKDAKLSSLIPAKYHGQSAYGRLQGNWQEWSLRAVPASKISSATQAKLRKALNQK